MRRYAGLLVLALLTATIGCETAYRPALPGQGLLGNQRFGNRFRPEPGVEPGALPVFFKDSAQADLTGGSPFQQTSQIHFLGPEGMLINYGHGMSSAFDSESIAAPGVHNFQQGQIYRLRLSNIPNCPGRELYPTLEIAPTFPRTQAFLEHNMVPIEFTDNDFDQVLSGNFITKVVYLPNPEFQGLATAGVGTLVNTQLEPGVDPIDEAQTRGSVLAVIRIGNKDLSLSEPEQQQQQQEADLPPFANMPGGEYAVAPQMSTANPYYTSNRMPNPPQLPPNGRTRPPKAQLNYQGQVAPPEPLLMNR